MKIRHILKSTIIFYSFLQYSIFLWLYVGVRIIEKIHNFPRELYRFSAVHPWKFERTFTKYITFELLWYKFRTLHFSCYFTSVNNNCNYRIWRPIVLLLKILYAHWKIFNLYSTFINQHRSQFFAQLCIRYSQRTTRDRKSNMLESRNAELFGRLLAGMRGTNRWGLRGGCSIGYWLEM